MVSLFNKLLCEKVPPKTCKLALLKIILIKSYLFLLATAPPEANSDTWEGEGRLNDQFHFLF